LSAEYADAVVTTRTERLCAEPPRPMQQAALEP
jgi:hypothetical protein